MKQDASISNEISGRLIYSQAATEILPIIMNFSLQLLAGVARLKLKYYFFPWHCTDGIKKYVSFWLQNCREHILGTFVHQNAFCESKY
jgi:hypothetical protein